MVPKEGKRSNSGQIPEVVPVPKQGGTGTAQHKPNGTGTDTSGTGTAQQNAICTGTAQQNAIGTGTAQQNAIGTGTDQSGTGTAVPKMPRFVYFAYLSLNSHTDCIGILLNV